MPFAEGCLSTSAETVQRGGVSSEHVRRAMVQECVRALASSTMSCQGFRNGHSMHSRPLAETFVVDCNKYTLLVLQQQLCDQ